MKEKKRLFKRSVIAFTLVAIMLFSISCTRYPDYEVSFERYNESQNALREQNEELIKEEAQACFNFFWECANTNTESKGYGLVQDRLTNKNVGSMASVGYGLAAFPAAIKYGWVTEKEARDRAEGTLDTLLDMENFNGFFYHFVMLEDGSRSGTSEISVIDSAILICGALTVGEYFGGSIKKKAEKIYNRIDWNFYVDKNKEIKDPVDLKMKSNKNYNMFYMSCMPKSDGSFEFGGAWDVYGEQLMMYVLGAGAKKANRISNDVWNAWKRYKGTYTSKTAQKNFTYINSWFGALFTHQFSHAFVDFYGYEDSNGVDWYENSVKASLASYYFSLDNSDKYPAFSEGSWGTSACDGPYGYNDGTSGIGSALAGNGGIAKFKNKNDTVTIAPYTAIASMPFTPEQSMAALVNYMSKPELQHTKYGLYDSYNIDEKGKKTSDPYWIANDVVGIDKGVTLLMLINYFDGGVWEYFMQSEYVKAGMDRLGFVQKSEAAAA